ncbi:MAG: amidohydrolase family protein, partial [Planctomycetales bacterium]|nr:amidohydrolase family protein [Planctomycetales bacterium]
MRTLTVWLALATLSWASVARAADVEYVVVMKGGLIVDGSGAVPFVGDVAFKGDRIVAVGKAPNVEGAKVIDATGLVVAPGFIDLHNHSDSESSLLDDENRGAENYVRQGCTTLVTGNCGGGMFPVADYLTRLEEKGIGLNVAHLIPHGEVRERVLGRRRQDPTSEQLEQLESLVAQGMREGAWGMSTGLIYVPSSYGKLDELAALAAEVRRHDGIYVSHIRSEESALLEAVGEALDVGRKSGAPVHISHLKVTGKPYWGTVRTAVRMIDDARQEGVKATADQYPYIASSTSLAAMLLPDWVREGGAEETSRRLADLEQLQRIRPDLEKALWERPHIRLVNYAPRPSYVGRALHEIAAEEGRELFDVAVEVMREGNPAAINFGMDEEDVRKVMQVAWVATASDGSVKRASGELVHPRSFGTFPRKIGRYAQRDGVVSLEAAVRSCSGLPADILGLRDRG